MDDTWTIRTDTEKRRQPGDPDYAKTVADALRRYADELEAGRTLREGVDLLEPGEARSDYYDLMNVLGCLLLDRYGWNNHVALCLAVQAMAEIAVANGCDETVVMHATLRGIEQTFAELQDDEVEPTPVAVVIPAHGTIH